MDFRRFDGLRRHSRRGGNLGFGKKKKSIRREAKDYAKKRIKRKVDDW